MHVTCFECCIARHILRCTCTQALESFVARSPTDAKPFLDQLLSEALKNIKYDPNYAVDDMDEDADDAGTNTQT